MSVESNGFRLKGVGGLGAALVAGRLSQAAAFFVMAHVLAPPEMANVVLLTLIYTGLFQLTNMGFERYIVYFRDTSQADLDAAVDTVWSMQIVRGLIVLPAAAGVAWYFDQSGRYDLGYPHVVAIGLAVMLLSLVNPGLSAFERSGNFAVVARVRGMSALLGAVANIAVVLVWHTSWAYVVGQLVNAALMTALSFKLVPRAPRLSFSMYRWYGAFGYCKHLLAISIVSFIAAHAQNLYVAAVMAPATLSAYFVWYRLVSLPGEFITQLSTSVLFAQASEVARRGHSIASAHFRGFTLVAVLIVPFHMFVWFHGDVVIRIVAGIEWVDYWWAGRLMILANLCLIFAGTLAPFMLVYLPHVTSSLRTGEAIVTVALIAVLGHAYQDWGVLIAVLTVMLAAVLIRIAILYLRLVRNESWRHAASSLTVLAIVVFPLFAIEGCVLLVENPSTQVFLAAVGYSLVAGSIAMLTLRRRGALIKGFL